MKTEFGNMRKIEDIGVMDLYALHIKRTVQQTTDQIFALKVNIK